MCMYTKCNNNFNCTQSSSGVIMCDSTASCLCNDITYNINAVQTVCSGPSTAPCLCSDEGCMVSVQSI